MESSLLTDYSWTQSLCWSIADKHCHCIVESNFPSPVGVRSNSSLVKGVLCTHSLPLMLGSARLELVRVLCMLPQPLWAHVCVCPNFLKSPPPLALTAFLLLSYVDRWALREGLYASDIEDIAFRDQCSKVACLYMLTSGGCLLQEETSLLRVEHLWV